MRWHEVLYGFYKNLQSIGCAEGEPELCREGAALRKRGGNVGIDGWANAVPNGSYDVVV